MNMTLSIVLVSLADITKYHRLEGSKPNLFFQFCRLRSLKSRFQQDLAPGEILFLTSKQLLCPHMAFLLTVHRVYELSSLSSQKDTNPIRSEPNPYNPFLTLAIFTLDVRASIYEFWKYAANILSHICKHLSY